MKRLDFIKICGLGVVALSLPGLSSKDITVDSQDWLKRKIGSEQRKEFEDYNFTYKEGLCQFDFVDESHNVTRLRFNPAAFAGSIEYGKGPKQIAEFDINLSLHSIDFQKNVDGYGLKPQLGRVTLAWKEFIQ